MRRLFVYGSGNQLSLLMAWDLRQGLPSLYVGAYSAPGANPCTYGHAAIAMPDGAIYLAGRGPNYFHRIDNVEVGGTTSRPSPSFSGDVYCQAVSETYWAIGGANPFLYVFDRRTFAFATVSTSGLGNVHGLDFSPDGTMLAVKHEGGTYLRVYDTSNWTYRDVASGICHQAGYFASFTPDGSLIVTKSANTYTRSLSAATLGVVANSTTALITRPEGSFNWSFVSPYVLRGAAGKELIAFPSNSSFRPVLFDASDFTISKMSTSDLQNSRASIDSYGNNFVNSYYYSDYYVGKLSLSNLVLEWFDGGVHSLRKSTQNYNTAVYPFVYTSNPHQITGTVRDITNNPAARVVQAFRRSDGVIMAQTTSDETTGDYRLEVFDTGPYDVRFKTADGELLNDLFYANVTPEPVV